MEFIYPAPQWVKDELRRIIKEKCVNKFATVHDLLSERPMPSDWLDMMEKEWQRIGSKIEKEFSRISLNKTHVNEVYVVPE